MTFDFGKVVQMGKKLLDNGDDLKNKTLLSSAFPEWTTQKECRVNFFGQSLRIVVTEKVPNGMMYMISDAQADELLSDLN